MTLRRLAVVSAHTSPLAQPGRGDGGGLNVYVRSLASGLARAGVDCDVFTRGDAVAGQPQVRTVEPGFRVIEIAPGPAPATRSELVADIDPFTDATLQFIERNEIDYDVFHGNYWVSGAVAHRLKHALHRPLVATFHTLARVKEAAGIHDDPPERARIEREVVGCSDLLLASTPSERNDLIAGYDAPEERVEILSPGVDHSLFTPGSRAGSRRALGVADTPTLLFVGRIQALKGADLALRTLHALGDTAVQLLVVGGPSGDDGHRELAALRDLVTTLGLSDQVRFVEPQPHHRLADFYRAADVCVVPSRTESFGLVALEAAACGTPVVASDVGGLRSLVDDGHTGFLVDRREPAAWAAAVATVLGDADLAAEMGTSAAARSVRYSWSITAARLRRLCGDLVARGLVQCR